VIGHDQPVVGVVTVAIQGNNKQSLAELACLLSRYRVVKLYATFCVLILDVQKLCKRTTFLARLLFFAPLQKPFNVCHANYRLVV